MNVIYVYIVCILKKDMNKKIRKELFFIFVGYLEWECNGRKFGKVLRNISLKVRNVRKILIFLIFFLVCFGFWNCL